MKDLIELICIDIEIEIRDKRFYLHFRKPFFDLWSLRQLA